ncbi:MAG: ATP-dependent Clp protease proteolytic subunit [Planctomycetota bacterium]
MFHSRFLSVTAFLAICCLLGFDTGQLPAQGAATESQEKTETEDKSEDKTSDDAKSEEDSGSEPESTEAKQDEKAEESKSASDKSSTEPKPSPKPDPRAKRISEMEFEIKELKAKTALEKARQDAELSALKLELERLSAEASLESARRKKATGVYGLETDVLLAENAMLKQKMTKLKQQGDIATLERSAALAEITSGIALAENREKVKSRVLSEIEYKSRPFQGGELCITDRRISLNGVITSATANYVTERIHFFNNQSDAPIFVVIDSSPGGSVMAGYRIVKAMEASDAPIHVVVKSYAASMAAIITTLADDSYAYPNAIILHHQMSSFVSGNMTQQAEQLEVNQEWARRLMEPVCEKLGTTPEEWVKEMYENSSTGDWEEFADRAQELGWVGNVVSSIREESVVKMPSTRSTGGATIVIGSTLEPVSFDGVEEVDERGVRFKRLPRLQPFDCYFVHDPTGYYRHPL